MRILECIALRAILELAEECFQSSFDLISHNKSIEQTTRCLELEELPVKTSGYKEMEHFSLTTITVLFSK